MNSSTRKERWSPPRAAAYQVLFDNHERLQGFRLTAARFFEDLLLDKERPFKRRPPVSLRLICAGDPAAKLIVHPAWDAQKKTVTTTSLALELMQEEVGKIKQREGDRDLMLYSRRICASFYHQPSAASGITWG
jgi:hypothetical protein